jgi:hypothetical protein
MIYKIVIAAGVVATPVTASFKTTGTFTASNSGYDVQYHKIRGSSHIALSNYLTNTDIFYTSSVAGAVANPIKAATLRKQPGSSLFSYDCAYGRDHITGPMVFSTEKKIAGINNYQVVYFRGAYSAWYAIIYLSMHTSNLLFSRSVQQKLEAPAEFFEQNFFGLYQEIDRHSLHSLAVGCHGCNVSHSNSGALYIYEPTAPDAKRWSQASVLTVPQSHLRLGERGVEIHKDIVIAAAQYGSVANIIDAFVYVKSKEGWSQEQILSLGHVATSRIDDLAVYDQTIVLSTPYHRVNPSNAGGSVLGAVHILYPSTEEFHLKPAGKPRPTQWSIQQVLSQPEAGTLSNTFGYMSLDRNRLAVGCLSSTKVYVYERKEVFGKWSLQQVLTGTTLGGQQAIQVRGSTIMTRTNGATTIKVYDETSKWDCLLISVEDHFNDGWDTAQLVVDVPDGDKDFFSPRCDVTNPFQFRYCPAAKDDKGLYKFAVPGGNKAKFHWEQVWRVYEEASGEWFTGNWDTKMDFEWDPDTLQFTHKKIERELPNNSTCNACKSKPTSKPTPGLRQLHSKDSTVHPTISPAPTIQTSVNIQPWQELQLITVGTDWFDAQHRGTSYYISTKDGKRLLSTGTMCPWETNPSTKTCWEDYPDGEYILRVGGALDRVTTHTFKFCGSVNPISKESQIVFRINNGECTIVSNIKSKNFCATNLHITQVSAIQISILGVSGALGSTEYAELRSAMASALPGASASGVTILSAVSTGSGITVTAEVQVDATTAGIDYSNIDTLDAFEVSAAGALSSKMLGALISGELASNLHSATHVDLVSFHLTGNGEFLDSHVGINEVLDFADALSSDAPSGESMHSNAAGTITRVMAVAGFVLAAVGVAVGAAFIVTGRPSPKIEAKAKEPVMSFVAEDVETVSSAPLESFNKKKSVRTFKNLSLEDMQELIKQEEYALEMMLKNGAPI